MSEGRIRVAKTGKDAETDGSVDMNLDSDKLLPKIYRNRKIIIPGGVTSYTVSHDLTYPHMLIAYSENDTLWTDDGYLTVMDPPLYSYEDLIHINDEEIRFFGADKVVYSSLFLDPLEPPATEPSPSSHNWGRIRIGSDIGVQPDYQTRVDSKYQTLKVHSQDSFSFSFSSLVLDYLDFKIDFYQFPHNLDYPPMFAPLGINSEGIDLSLIYDGFANIPTTININEVNNIWVEKFMYGSTGTEVNFEIVSLFVDEDNFYVYYRRQCNDPANNVTFPARTINLDYTIFLNSITEEFNLL